MVENNIQVLFLQRFKLIGDEIDLSKEPFSKLRRDMAYELGLKTAPYGCFKIQKHYNLTYFSHKLCFNVKIIRKP